MRLSELLGMDVVDHDGQELGTVQDATLIRSQGTADLEVAGVLVGGKAIATRLGYLHGEVRGPWIIRILMRMLAREGRFIPWRDVIAIDERRVTVRIFDDPRENER